MAFNAVGLPGSAREFAVEGEKAVFVPFFIGTLSRKGTERLVAVHAGNGARVEAVEQALHQKVDVLRRAMRENESRLAPARTLLPESETLTPELRERSPTDARPCRCGAPMVLRHRKADGAAFWGCSTFPKCRHTEPI